MYLKQVFYSQQCVAAETVYRVLQKITGKGMQLTKKNKETKTKKQNR